MSLKSIAVYDSGHGDRPDVIYTFYWAVWAKNVVVNRDNGCNQMDLTTNTPAVSRALYKQLKKRGCQPCVMGPRTIREYQSEWNSFPIQTIRKALVGR